MENTALQVMPDNNNLTPIPLTPEEQVTKASEMAKVLQRVVDQAGLARSFGGKKKHLEFEAWQTIGQFFNSTPVTEWTKPIMDKDKSLGGKIVGWESRVVVKNVDGRTIAAAESMCMRDEPNWKSKPNYALRSMSQTRAAGKALRSVFAFVAVLAGYSATPSEEMMDSFNKPTGKKQNKPEPQTNGNAKPATAPQYKKLYAMLKEQNFDNDAVDLFKDFIKEKYKVETITKKIMSQIFDNFEKAVNSFVDWKIGNSDNEPPQEPPGGIDPDDMPSPFDR
jgi:hypothetical protein